MSVASTQRAYFLSSKEKRRREKLKDKEEQKLSNKGKSNKKFLPKLSNEKKKSFTLSWLQRKTTEEGVEKLACKNLKRKFRDSHFSAARSMRKVKFDKDEREKRNVMPLIYGSHSLRLKLYVMWVIAMWSILCIARQFINKLQIVDFLIIIISFFI